MGASAGLTAMANTGSNQHNSGEGTDVELTVGPWTTVHELLELAGATSGDLKTQLGRLMTDPVGERLLTVPVDVLNVVSTDEFGDEWLERLGVGTVDKGFCRWITTTLSPHFKICACFNVGRKSGCYYFHVCGEPHTSLLPPVI